MFLTNVPLSLFSPFICFHSPNIAGEERWYSWYPNKTWTSLQWRRTAYALTRLTDPRRKSRRCWVRWVKERRLRPLEVANSRNRAGSPLFARVQLAITIKTERTSYQRKESSRAAEWSCRAFLIPRAHARATLDRGAQLSIKAREFEFAETRAMRSRVEKEKERVYYVHIYDIYVYISSKARESWPFRKALCIFIPKWSWFNANGHMPNHRINARRNEEKITYYFYNLSSLYYCYDGYVRERGGERKKEGICIKCNV